MPLLTVFAEMKAAPGRERDLRAALTCLVEPTRREAGCVLYDLHENNDIPGHFIFYEHWESPGHLDGHDKSDHILAFRAIAPSLLAEPARILKFTKIA